MENPNERPKESPRAPPVQEPSKTQKQMENLKKKVRVLEKRYQSVYKNNKVLEEIYISNFKSLYTLFKAELFQKETLENEFQKKTEKEFELNTIEITKQVPKAKELFQRIFQRIKELITRTGHLESKEKERNRQQEQWAHLENQLRTENLKQREEMAEKSLTIQKLESLLRQKERMLTDLESKVNKGEETSHEILKKKLHLVQKKDKEEEFERKISEQMDLIIRLRDKVARLKLAKMVVKKNEDDIALHDQESQTDLESAESHEEQDHHCGFNFEGQKSESIGRSLEFKTVTNLGCKDGAKMLPSMSNWKMNGRDKRAKKENSAEKMRFLTDVVGKYFDYRIKGKTQEENLTLKVILDALELDLEKKMQIQSHEEKAKKFFKLF